MFIRSMKKCALLGLLFSAGEESTALCTRFSNYARFGTLVPVNVGLSGEGAGKTRPARMHT
jgi:hypothetical protein